MNSALLLKLIDLGIAVSHGVPAAVDAYSRVKRMVDEGRDPTEEEIAELADLTDAQHEQIQQA